MRPYCRFITLATSLLVVGANRADADLITLSASFVASGFRTAAPVDPVTGTYSVTFDNRSLVNGETTGITVSNLNIDVDAPPAFFYNPEVDLLILGSTLNGFMEVHRDTNDFFLVIGHASTQPIDVVFDYAQRGSEIFQGVATVTPTPAQTPEPTTMALLATGVTIAVLLRRRRAPKYPAALAWPSAASADRSNEGWRSASAIFRSAMENPAATHRRPPSNSRQHGRILLPGGGI